jgi:regulator of sigma E protease
MHVTILATIVVLGVLILIHELGHFWAAKAVDIEVSRFSIGFGPKLFGFRRGETEYVVSAIPLGGYVKMEGMAEEEAMAPLEGRSEPRRERSPRDFDQKPLWARVLVVSAGVLMNFLFAYLVFVSVARTQGVMVPLIAEVEAGWPAEAAGFQAGDVVVAVDGQRLRERDEVIHYIALRPGVEMTLTVERGESALDLTVTPRLWREYDEFARDTVERGRIGVSFPNTAEAQRSLALGEAVVEGGHRTWWWVAQIGDFLARIVTGRSSAKELGGPIVIGQLSGEFARAGIWPLLEFMAIISVNLAVLNLLPIPVLDGGHLLFLGIEAVRGRAVSVEQRLRLTQIGILLVVGLMVWAFANDILRLVGA